ncbi:hypothetical protein NHQ30_007034 [Ciborinia camelliae]|nr:hypothetical protein NHQ30_007034 [Ciborinia camelliae]
MPCLSHPISVFVLETTLMACIIAGTPPKSRVRFIGLLLIIGCVYTIVLTSASHMRLPWAIIISSDSILLLLQYIDIALLNKLSFLPDTGNGRKTISIPVETNALARIKWGFQSTFTFRYVNTSMEVKNVPQFHRAPGRIGTPSRSVFVLKAIITATLCYLTLDFFSLQPPPETPVTLFSWQSVSLFGRIRQITTSELTVRAIASIIYWVSMFCTIQGTTSFAGGIAVALKLSRVNSWRPIFGSILDAYSLRNFWG